MSKNISNDDFKAIMGKFAAGVTVVTTVDGDGKLWGLTATAFTALSMEPPLCLVCIDKNTASHGPLSASRKYAVNILSDKQEDVSNTFASRRDDKFEQVKHEAGSATGCPVFPEALGVMECEVTEILPGGDHDIFVGEIKSVQVSDGNPLVYWGGAYGDVTSRPKQW